MKKVLLIFLIMLVVGCGSNVTNFDTKVVSTTIEEKLKGMEVIQDSTLTDAYNLDLTKMDEHLFKQNEDGDLYAIIKTTDKVNVKKLMKEYFGKVREFNTAYSPERLEILDSRCEKEVGDYLIYIVAKDSDQIYNTILSKIS